MEARVGCANTSIGKLYTIHRGLLVGQVLSAAIGLTAALHTHRPLAGVNARTSLLHADVLVPHVLSHVECRFHQRL